MSENSIIHIFQKGFNYSQDGPGNRLVYHLSGCNLKCPWCSNPEGMEITKTATTLTVESIVKEALSCKMMFIDGGGVTLTGGEVTCQKDAVTKLLNLLKENGIHTCIETNTKFVLNWVAIVERVKFRILVWNKVIVYIKICSC